MAFQIFVAIAVIGGYQILSHFVPALPQFYVQYIITYNVLPAIVLVAILPTKKHSRKFFVLYLLFFTMELYFFTEISLLMKVLRLQGLLLTCYSGLVLYQKAFPSQK